MFEGDPLQVSLAKAVEMQVQEITGSNNDADPDETYAMQIWQQELLGAKRPNSFSTPKPAKRRQSIVQGKECSTCFETKRDRDITELECCKTLFCRTCFQMWFETSLADKMVPKCCGQEVIMEDHMKLLKAVIRKRYSEVKDEVNADRKIYCSNSGCGRFIKIEDTNVAFAQCRKCRRKTCVACGDALTAHGKKRRTCPNYLNDETLREILSSHEWNRCPACFAPVEKTEGCNNIRCTCGTMFCFRCGDRKKGESDGCTCTRLPLRQNNQTRPTPVMNENIVTRTPESVDSPPNRAMMISNLLQSTSEQADTVPNLNAQSVFAYDSDNAQTAPANESIYPFQIDDQDNVILSNPMMPLLDDDTFDEDMKSFMTWLASLRTPYHTYNEAIWE